MRYALTTDAQLVSIEQYAALPSPPRELVCPGRAPDGTPCRAATTPRALESRYVRPHFWARGHLSGCDEGADAARAAKGHRDGTTTTRTRHQGPVLLLVTAEPSPATGTRTPTTRTPDAGRPMATAVPGPADTRSAPTRTTATLSSLLTRVLDGRLDPRTHLVLPDGTKGQATRLVAAANTLTTDDQGTHGCFYGRITDYAENTATRSVFLHLTPRPGVSRRSTAALMIRQDQAPGIQDKLHASIGELEGHHVMVIGTLRVSRNRSSLYIELDNDTSIVYQH
nr:Uncharacterised protein [Actinomyces israelii]